MVEYALIAVLVAVVVIVAVSLVGKSVKSTLSQVSAGLAGTNLVANGYGQLGNNSNFSQFIFDAANKPAGNANGSFLCPSSGQLESDAYIPVNPAATYNISMDAMSGEAGGADYNAGNVQYAGLAPFDADGNQILPSDYGHYPGATDTTLAAPLNPGATTMTLTNATGWQNGGPNYQREFVWWPYTSAGGLSYANYTYTRNTSYYSFNTYKGAAGTWNAGAISGNTITLSAPWPGATLPTGTPVRNSMSFGTFLYTLVAGTAIPNAWTHYSGSLNGLDSTGSGPGNLFPYGTATVKALLLCNWGATPNNVRIANFVLSPQ